jgi:hypothetical protein
VGRNLKIVGMIPPAFQPEPINRVGDIPGRVPKESRDMTDDADKCWSKFHEGLCQCGP